MTLKRRNSSSPECEASAKKQNLDTDPHSNDNNHEVQEEAEGNLSERPQTYNGQSGAFPGLGHNDELFYGPAANGIDYLRMVRSEAKSIPELLSAQGFTQTPLPREDTTGTTADHEDGGYWYDGAYTAKPFAELSENDRFPQAQLQYYEAILAQFALLQATLKCVPPLAEVEKLSSSHLISFPSNSKQARRQWEEQILTRDPSPVQLACMNEASVLTLLGLMCRRIYAFFQIRDPAQFRRISLWIWSALGKCPGREVLDSDEIAELRELAKRAVRVTERLVRYESIQTGGFADVQFADQNTDEDDDEVDEVAILPEDQATGGTSDNDKIILQEKLMCLDMIVTTIGEVYGQRDLLRARRDWAYN